MQENCGSRARDGGFGIWSGFLSVCCGGVSTYPPPEIFLLDTHLKRAHIRGMEKTAQVLKFFSPLTTNGAVLLGLREELQFAVKAFGGEITGTGMGVDGADIEISVEGFRYAISIKPVEAESESAE
jgi:hypothetical protein